MNTFNIDDRVFDDECPSGHGTILICEHPSYYIRWDNGNCDWSDVDFITHLHKQEKELTVEEALNFLLSQGYEVTIKKEAK